MSAEMNFIEELTEEKKERFHKAVKKLEDMEEKIAPFARHKIYKERSTEGEWGIDTY